MPSTLSYRSLPTVCVTCGRNLATDDTHVTGWVGRRIVYYCAASECDPRKERG